MQFVIIGINGKPICDDAGIPMVMPSRDDAMRWITHGETVLPYVAARRGLLSVHKGRLRQRRESRVDGANVKAGREKVGGIGQLHSAKPDDPGACSEDG